MKTELFTGDGDMSWRRVNISKQSSTCVIILGVFWFNELFPKPRMVSGGLWTWRFSSFISWNMSNRKACLASHCRYVKLSLKYNSLLSRMSRELLWAPQKVYLKLDLKKACQPTCVCRSSFCVWADLIFSQKTTHNFDKTSQLLQQRHQVVFCSKHC